VEFRRFHPNDLPDVLRLCAQENWPSFVSDPARAARALQAPGVTTIVATENDVVVGFAHLMSDGEIQAHFSLLAVARDHRRKGIGRAMIERALAEAGGDRFDLVTDSAEEFYAALPHRRMAGFRIYPRK